MSLFKKWEPTNQSSSDGKKDVDAQTRKEMKIRLRMLEAELRLLERQHVPQKRGY